MGYNTDEAKWPKVVPASSRALVEEFYKLLDSPDDKVGDILADKIFTADGVARFGNNVFEGTEQIRQCRKDAYVAVASRRHTVKEVFVASDEAYDLLFLGWVEMHLVNGRDVGGDFVGRLKFRYTADGDAKLTYFGNWGDPTALLQALKGE